ncbi:pectin acetylesterase-family hydrolase [Streptococcus sp. S784/96/1]|uniref:pectin acetylesterase-family hydrolase n=1 Tax=Streptococcus sp. S784/96/1 TaxID=2653499 RepID=UPI001389589A|nr:pectin acetylesterase-family hydrolase [Streptococcus sp. S784/96/1]
MTKQPFYKKKFFKVFTVILASLALIGFAAYKQTFGLSAPELRQERPDVGKWYRLSPDGVVDSTGQPAHGLLRIGKDKNKVMVYFFGGGVSINAETAAAGKAFYATSTKQQDFVATWGIGSSQEDNPFKDWTILALPYSTGDFHAGTGEFSYTDKNGQEKILHHKGYQNLMALLSEAKTYMGNPDTLLVTGFSAGGFATSLLADDVIDQFPTAKNITVAVDSSLLLHEDWKGIAERVWQTPDHISDRLNSNNLVLDSLVALHDKRGDTVKILFDSSYRDGTLQQYQNYIDKGQLADPTPETSQQFQAELKAMVDSLQSRIDGVGIYVWNHGQDDQTTATQHTTINFPTFFTPMTNDKSIADWMDDAVNGDVKSYGLELLNK